MTSTHNAGFQIVPAVRSDIARIAQLTVNSLDATPASQFLFKPAVYREGRLNAAMTAYFVWRTEAAFDDPTAEVIKAIDQSSGEILGFATWQFVEKYASGTKSENGVVGVSDHKRDDVPAIVQYVNMDLMQDYFTSTGHNQVQISHAIRGESSAYLWHLYVDPSTKQGGVGTLLMKWGLDRVDAKGIASSVVSTPNARDFYARFGFAEISHVDLDITKVRGQLLGFGVWRQYGMIRPAGLAGIK